MGLYDSKTYMSDLETAVSAVADIEKLNDRSFLVTGASCLIGSFIVDTLVYYNEKNNAGIKVCATGRSIKRLEERFGAQSDSLCFAEYDVNDVPSFDFRADYIIHAASNAYPAAFNDYPVDTVMSNVSGTYNLLEYARKVSADRFMFISSGEVYGQGDLSLDAFSEDYSGYVDILQPRSCYPSAKRTAETLCVSYTKQYGVDTVIARPCHTYGPNATQADNRANVQFVNNALAGNDIVLNSAGNQMRSYNYVADCVSAILTVLIKGESATAYNIANPDVRTTIAGFAREVAEQTGHRLIFAKPDEVALAQRTPIAKQVLDTTRLTQLGWKGCYSLADGVAHTLAGIREKE